MKDYSDYSINKDIFFSGAERKYEILVHFNDVGESTLEQDKELYQYSYQDIHGFAGTLSRDELFRWF